MSLKTNNKQLNDASKAKNDEFYTQLVDVENELKHYRDYFEDKVVYCNCDDPSESAFFHYFFYNFKKLKLKKLLTTCYKSKNRDLFSDNNTENAIYLEYNGSNSVMPSKESIDTHYLKSDGDFRSNECINLLKEADIIVTNPPFSIISEYIKQLIEYNKFFIIVAPYNAITYRDIFPYFKNNQMWLGNGFSGGNAYFKIKTLREFAKGVFNEETGLVKFRNITWFTNLDHNKRKEELILYRLYNTKDYPKYDNFDAIEVGYTRHIPINYNGLMGVPVSFFDKYNPKQFEILGNAGSYAPDGYSLIGALYLSGKKKYKRIIIKNRLL